ncbi:universal stress protein [Nocardia sp. NPDC058379]|uniref:universal stress protein n=1 Tax=unclassified Nocardia TaxID=2637762 RepID=UPI0036539242
MSASNSDPVVVGVDGSDCALGAVRWAARTAVLRGASLQVVYAMSSGWDLGRAGIVSIDDQSFRDAGDVAVARAASIAVAEAAPRHLDVETSVVSPGPVAALRRRARHAQLLAVGTRGLGTFERTLLGSVSTALARRPLCPLAVIPQPGHPASDRLPVLVGLDGSPGSEHALDIAIEEAARRGVGLVALRAWGEPAPGLRESQMTEHTHRLLGDTLVGYGEKYPGVPITRIVTGDDPAQRLLRESARAQLLVLGSHRRGERDGFGSVSRTVLHATEIPLIVLDRR